MFSKLSLLAIVAPLVAGFTIQAPQNPVSAGTITVNWTSTSTDPSTFSLELVNVDFHDSFAIANNVNTDSGSITITIGVVPVRDGYTLKAVNIGNIDDVFATSAPFSIGANPSASQASTVSSTASGASSATTAVTTTSLSTGAVTTTRSVSTSTAIGSTITTRSSSGTSGGTSSATSAGASTTSSTSPNSAVSALKMNTNVGGFAAVLFSVIAGAAIIAL